MPAAEIRRRFVEFFAERGHTVVPSASLVPAGDQTLLFTNSGMVQFKDVLHGAETRSYNRAVDFQRCLRVAGKHNDFEEVGRTPRHHTFFEMLGNWSFGDYFKREAIHWAWDFLTEDLGIPADAPRRDDLQRRRRSPGPSGATRSACRRSGWRAGAMSTPATTATSGGWPTPGPCGPCSEIHFDRGAHLSEGPRVRPRSQRDLPALARDLEPRLHGVRPAARRPRAAAVPERRHGHGPRASRERAPAGPDATTTPTSSRRSTPGCASCWATTPRPSRASASATR